MNIINITKIGAAALLLGAAVSCTSHNTLTRKEKAEGWVLLFNGENTEGWRNFNSDNAELAWHVVDGCLQANGVGDDANGYIVTDKEYENFILSWDWKLSKGGNSGMLYHVVEHPKFKVPYVTGPEYQLIDVEGWEEAHAPTKLEEWQKIGVDYAMHLPDQSKMHINHGDWNNSMIVFDNGHVEHWLNGEKILEFEAWTDDWFARKASGKWGTATEYGLAHKGVICVQDHGYPASFRNIKIKELPRKAESKTISLFNGKDLTGWELFGSMRVSVDEEGNLVTQNGEDLKYGYLGTREYYKDFDLTVEFKQMSNGNSGLFFHSFVHGGYASNKVNGWQCEVAPKGNDTGGIYESYGRGWLIQIPDEKEEILKEGEWNTLRLRVEGNKVQTWLNGQAMIELDDELIGSKTGRIMLQIHDGNNITVKWRNFNLTTL